MIITNSQMQVFADYSMKEFVTRMQHMAVNGFPDYVEQYGKEKTEQKTVELIEWLLKQNFELETDIESYLMLYFSREDLRSGKLAKESIRIMELKHLLPSVRIDYISGDSFKENYSK